MNSDVLKPLSYFLKIVKCGSHPPCVLYLVPSDDVESDRHASVSLVRFIRHGVCQNWTDEFN